MQNLMFKLRQWWDRALAAYDRVAFSIKLRRMVLTHGSVENTVKQGEQVLDHMTDADHKALRFSITLTKICEHYKLEPLETRLGCLYGDMLHNRLSCQEVQDELYAVVFNPCPALAAHLHLLENGDITPQKYQYFGPPAPFDTIESWLLSLH